MTNEKKHFMDLFFNPRSVAIVGASRNQPTPNYWLTANLVNLKYPGKIYPVNPNATEILGLKCYPSVRDIEGEVDIAAISVPAQSTLNIVKDCIAKGVKGVIIIAGGFSEIGENGQGLQDEIKRLLKENGIRCVGPNSLSPMNSAINFIIGFAPSYKLPVGRLSFIFQSGLYQPRLDYLLNELHINVNKLIDLGNKMDISEVDTLEYLAQDVSTEVIALHIESIAGEGRRFFQLLKEITPKKPIIILKSGRTPAGAKAASSHTGAIIKDNDTVFDTALKQAGAIRVQGLDEFFDLAKIFEYYQPMKGNRIAIASFSGGEGVISTDFSYANGLILAQPSEKSMSTLRTIMPPWEIPVNPYDTGVANQFSSGDVVSVYVNTLATDPNVDCMAIQIGGPQTLITVNSPSVLGKWTESYLRAVRQGKRLAVWPFDPRNVKEMTDILETQRIPVYPSAERAVRALGALYRYETIKERDNT
jgi:acyl-CoA synthetase (NDP forming)